MIRRYYGLILIFLLPNLVTGQLYINEILSSNALTLVDEDGDHSDWIEIVNTADTPIELKDYYLSDKKGNIQKWQFPDIEMTPNSYLIIFCSKKNRQQIGSPLHSNFKISADGEVIILAKFDQVIQMIAVPAMEEDYSYLAYPDGGGTFYYSANPSPNAPNTLPSEVHFSEKSGIYSKSFNLELSLLPFSADYEIRYTLNSEDPIGTSLLYTDIFTINDRSLDDNVWSLFPSTPDYSNWSGDAAYPAWVSPDIKLPKGTVIKAGVFFEGVLVSAISTHVYFVFPEGKDKFSLPVLSIVTPKSNLFDDEHGIYVPGNTIVSDNLIWTGNYFENGRNWERPASFEYFVDGKSVLSQPVGIRIQGGKTRGAAQKSLKIYSRSEYGQKRLDYPFFKDKKQDSYKRLLLRTTMASWSGNIITDAFAHEAAKGLNFKIQHNQPVVLFLNGEYWGVQELREKIDRYKYADDFEIDPDSVTIYASYGDVVEGEEEEDFLYFRDKFLAEHDIMDSETYHFVESVLDFDNIIDYFFAEMFFGNRDWPGNNLQMWRSTQVDNKWRWIYYDLDGGIINGQIDDNMVELLLNPEQPYSDQPIWSVAIIRTLMQNQDFAKRFIDRVTYLLNNDFSSVTLLSKLAALELLYEKELPLHFQRWQGWLSFVVWKHALTANMKTFLLNRPCVFAQQMEDYFNLENIMACDAPQDLDLQLFPNPTSGYLTVFLDTKIPQIYHLNIINSLGQKVLENDILSTVDTVIDLNSFPSGIYYLCFINSTTNEVVTRKLVKL